MSNEIIKTVGRHFVLTHGRSGSNFLVNTLNRHPALVNYGEALGEWSVPYKIFCYLHMLGVEWDNYLDLLYTMRIFYYGSQAVSAVSHMRDRKKINFKWRGNIVSVGLKDFAFLIEKRGLMDYLQSRSDIRVLHLFRRNHLKRYISLLNMHATGVVKSEARIMGRKKLVIDVADMIDKLQVFEKEETVGFAIANVIPKNRIFQIDYDEYFSDPDVTKEINSLIFKFLGVADMALMSSQKKIMSNKLVDCIDNYDEVCDALSGSRLERFLL